MQQLEAPKGKEERGRDRDRETEREDLSLFQSCWTRIRSEKKRGFTFHHPTVHCDQLFFGSNKNRKHTKAENAVHKTRKKDTWEMHWSTLRNGGWPTCPS